jgi:thiamine biosynthesis lipoprotein
LLTGLAAVIALAVWRPLADTGRGLHEFTGPTMGTSFTVSVDADLSDADRERVEGLIAERLAWVNGLMSTFDSSSEVSVFNAHQSTAPFTASKELLELLRVSHDVSERSGGAFDVTVAPLVDAWGFGRAEPSSSVPDEQRLAALRPLVDYRGIVLDPAAGTMSKSNPAVTIDLSAIASGWGADVVAAALEGLGLSSVLVDVGGELRAVGTRRDGTPWRVGIERPDAAALGVFGTVDLIDEGIATSGDYRNYLEVDGVRYSHIIDPRTGRPIRARDVSVTVVAPDAATADAWATALTVLGPEAGYEIAVREGIAALFVARIEGRLESRVTPALASRFVPADEEP